MVSLTCGCHVSSDGRVTQQCTAHSMETQLLGPHADEVARLEILLTASEKRVRVLDEGMEQLIKWSKAYPLDLFPEPDMVQAAAVLKDAGLTLDAISASNMRHVIARVGEIARQALGDSQ